MSQIDRVPLLETIGFNSPLLARAAFMVFGRTNRMQESLANHERRAAAALITLADRFCQLTDEQPDETSLMQVRISSKNPQDRLVVPVLRITRPGENYAIGQFGISVRDGLSRDDLAFWCVNTDSDPNLQVDVNGEGLQQMPTLKAIQRAMLSSFFQATSGIFLAAAEAGNVTVSPAATTLPGNY